MKPSPYKEIRKVEVICVICNVKMERIRRRTDGLCFDCKIVKAKVRTLKNRERTRKAYYLRKSLK